MRIVPSAYSPLITLILGDNHCADDVEEENCNADVEQGGKWHRVGIIPSVYSPLITTLGVMMMMMMMMMKRRRTRSKTRRRTRRKIIYSMVFYFCHIFDMLSSTQDTT